MDELLGGPAGEAAVADLPGVGHGQQLLAVGNVHALTLRQCQHDLLVLLGCGSIEVDGHAEAGSQRQLFLHSIGAVDVAAVLHVRPVIPGFPNQVAAVGGGIDQHVIRPRLHAAFDDRL